MANITASCGFSFNWVENQAVRSFMNEFFPFANSISSYQLSNRIVPREVERFRQAAKNRCRGSDVTLQTDGWTGINFHYLVAFMITTANREVHTVRVTDVSAERKTAQHLKVLIISVIEEVQMTWKANVVAVTSDASGESRAARKQLVMEFPWLVSADCYAHQINLVVGDYFKTSGAVVYLAYSKKASELITWLRSKTLVLASLRDIQYAINSTNPSQTRRVLTVIRAVLTRWTAHYLAFRRLLDLKFALDILVMQEKGLRRDSKIITGDAASRKKATEMLKLIEDPVMWMILARMVVHLQPLSLVINIAQAAHCRLDEVLIIFGFLISRYIDLRGKATSVEEKSMIQAIIDSLEKRWSKCDQDVFLAAVILNPLYRIKPFTRLRKFTNAGIVTLLVKLWDRFFPNTPSDKFRTELLEYLEGHGDYGVEFTNWVDLVRSSAETERKRPDPLKMYEGIRFQDAEPTPLQKFAHRIFSICANSASCERLFSLFGTVLTKLRSRLGLKGLTDLAELRLHLRDEYMQMGDKKGRLRRARKIIPDPLHPPPPPPVTSETSTDSLQPEDLGLLHLFLHNAPSTMKTLQVQSLYPMISPFNNFLTSQMRVGLD